MVGNRTINDLEMQLIYVDVCSLQGQLQTLHLDCQDKTPLPLPSLAPEPAQDEEGFVNPDFFWQDSKQPYWKAACAEDTFSGSRVSRGQGNKM